MSQDSELAWAAGFFDGEGWVGSRHAPANKKYRYRRIEVGIGQVDPRVLERFQVAMGIGQVKGPYYGDVISRGSQRRPRWYYCAVGAVNVWRMFWDLEPYLSPVKREQFTSALDWYENAPVRIQRG